jgi:hypothetical protein
MQVEGSRLVGGIIYVTYGPNIGYFNGNGITFLKKMGTSTATYSQNMTNMENLLLVRDGLNVLAFGDLGAGNTWWKLYKNTANTNHINNIAYQGDNKLLVAYKGATDGSGMLSQVDYDNAGISGAFYTNRISFGREVLIRRITLWHDVSASAGTTRFSVLHRNLDGTETEIRDVNYVNQSISKTIINTDPIVTDTFQLKISPSNDDTGFKRIRIYYDPNE